jgi:hypothetical protein
VHTKQVDSRQMRSTELWDHCQDGKMSDFEAVITSQHLENETSLAVSVRSSIQTPGLNSIMLHHLGITHGGCVRQLSVEILGGQRTEAEPMKSAENVGNKSWISHFPVVIRGSAILADQRFLL